MDTRDVQQKLQKAYHSMLEHVEELVEKDKKPLKEAFYEAEEKLSEWRELSKEEIDYISDELKSNLEDLGETTNRINESIKQTLEFDTNYLANSIWNSLSKVADQTKLELSELNKNLQKHMATDASNFSEQQHIWFKDTQQWENNYEKALSQLNELRAGVRRQVRKTHDYHKTICAGESSKEKHDLLAQINQEITTSVDDLYNKLLEDDHD